jgi:hypothetical protein
VLTASWPQLAFSYPGTTTIAAKAERVIEIRDGRALDTAAA